MLFNMKTILERVEWIALNFFYFRLIINFSFEFRLLRNFLCAFHILVACVLRGINQTHMCVVRLD